MAVESVFIELSTIIVIAVVVSYITRLLKQPLIIGYIGSGILVSPYFLNIVSSTDAISTFSQIGVALLLFMVGLNLNPKMVKDVGRVALITGLGQVLFTSVIGFLICKSLGFSVIESVYIAVALTFSSTIIIMKLLTDRGDVETLYGRISMGFLIIQDIVAIFILMVVPSTTQPISLAWLAFETIIKGLSLTIILFLFGLYVLPIIVKSIAKSQEFLLLFSIGWCMAVASLFHFLNFSIEVGALLAGVALSLSPFRYEISSKMKPLRDFFIVLFFILLGSQMVFSNINDFIIPIILLSAFILIGNPLIVMILMGALGYTKRNSFLAGLTVAQISEFSLILIMMGVSTGHLNNDILSFVTIIGLITIAGSTYFIMYSDKIYPRIAPLLSVFERAGPKVDEHRHDKDDTYNIILFGHNRIGYDLLEMFEKLNKKFIVVDYNPDTIQSLSRRGIPCRYGDAGDLELLNDLKLENVKMAVSTIPNAETNVLLLKTIKKRNQKTIFIAVSHNIDEALRLYKNGADYVIMPHFLCGYHTSSLIKKYGFDSDKFSQDKNIHIEYLKARRDLGHEHPNHNI